jgi:ribosomal protein S18 acetylase RimI-like enzyme
VSPASGPGAPRHEVTTVRGGAERIPDLQPLWESLHEQHAAVAPELAELGPVRSADESWLVRRALYREWLAEPDAFVLVAEASSGPVGYALVHMRGPEETWATGDRIAELETLGVLPAFRGRGTSMALTEAVQRELRRIGTEHMAVSVIASNEAALRFYERLGLQRSLVSYIGAVPPASEIPPA